jgi:hypothetical protein
VRCKIVTSGTPQGNISILLEGVSGFTNLHISRSWDLFPTSFYWVNVCLLLLSAKSTHLPFDQILRKVVECVSNKLLWVLITVVVSTTDMVYIFYLRKKIILCCIYSERYRVIKCIFTLADNLCCQIRGDDNSSTCDFTMGRSVLLMEHP